MVNHWCLAMVFSTVYRCFIIIFCCFINIFFFSYVHLNRFWLFICVFLSTFINFFSKQNTRLTTFWSDGSILHFVCNFSCWKICIVRVLLKTILAPLVVLYMLQCLISSIPFPSSDGQVGSTVTKPVLAVCLIVFKNRLPLPIIPNIYEASKNIFKGCRQWKCTRRISWIIFLIVIKHANWFPDMSTLNSLYIRFLCQY